MVSLHLKATMMKISDPILFGHAVKVYFKDAFAKHADTLAKVGANPNDGLGQVLDSLKGHPAVLADFAKCYESRPPLAMVDSAKGITNLHVPSDVIIDASMPCVVRDSGKMWNKCAPPRRAHSLAPSTPDQQASSPLPVGLLLACCWLLSSPPPTPSPRRAHPTTTNRDDALENVICIIPDRCYATMYSAIIEDCKLNGQFDVTTMGNVANVGLMAQKAEEYGSHDKTFECAAAGTMRVVDNSSGAPYFEHSVQQGDVWRMCQTKDAPIKDWVRLAVARARATGDPTTFWLDASRAHDASLIAKVEKYMPEYDTKVRAARSTQRRQRQTRPPPYPPLP